MGRAGGTTPGEGLGGAASAPGGLSSLSLIATPTRMARTAPVKPPMVAYCRSDDGAASFVLRRTVDLREPSLLRFLGRATAENSAGSARVAGAFPSTISSRSVSSAPQSG